MFDEAPTLPYDYIMSFIISLCPYIWRTVMDPRVEALKNKEKLSKEVEESSSRAVK